MIKLSSPDIRDSDLELVAEVLRSGNLVQGVQVRRLEEALSEFTGVPSCAVVSSCTAALHLSLHALELKPGDGVLVPAFTFPATANVVENIGGRVVLCDVDPETYVITPDRIEAALADRSDVRAIMVVHEFGHPAAVLAITAFARDRGLKVIEDAACALGTIAEGAAPGHYGDVACYSFHPRKAITTGEGGAVVSSDSALIDRIKRLRNHGIQPGERGVADFVEAGLNYRMTDFQAALGIAQFSRFADELSKRQAITSRYRALLGGRRDLAVPATDPGHSWQSFMVVLDSRIDRDAVRSQLRERGVETNLGAQALNCLTYFRRRYGVSDHTCPNATALFRRGLVLPLHGKLSMGDVEEVCVRLVEVLDAGATI